MPILHLPRGWPAMVEKILDDPDAARAVFEDLSEPEIDSLIYLVDNQRKLKASKIKASLISRGK